MSRWAQFVIRTRWMWIIGWPVIALAVWMPAPRIPTLLRDDPRGFVPADMPSEQALRRLRAEFPEHAPASRAAVLFHRGTGLTDQDRAAIGRIANELVARSIELDWRVTSAATSPLLAPLLESTDGQASVVAIDLPAALLTHSTVNRVREVRENVRVGSLPQGLNAHVTGSGALGELLDRNAKKDIDRTTLWTFVGVMLILLIAYRSPTAMLLPIVTIALSLLLALGLIGWAAGWGLPLNGLLEMFVIVVLVGAGVDYCLFLFGRFREASREGMEPHAAVHDAVSHTGTAILASAGTNVVGLATLILGRHRDLHTSGPTIAAALCLAALAALTLAPALMHVFAGRLVRVTRSAHRKVDHIESFSTRVSTGDVWSIVARWATIRPALTAAIVVIALTPFAILGARIEPLYDSFEEYPADSDFVRGARLYAKHFHGTSDISELTILVPLQQRVAVGAATGRAIAAAPHDASDGESPARPEADAHSLDSVRKTMNDFAAALASRFPVVYQRDLADPLGVNRRNAPPDTQHAAARTSGAIGLLDRLAAGLTASISESAAGDFYVGQSGRVVRVDVGLALDSRANATMDQLPEIRQIVRDTFERNRLRIAGGTDAQISLLGDTPLYADLRELRERDFRVIGAASILAIGLVLLVLVRSVAQTAILLAATLLTYLSAYGLTWLIFRQWFDVSSLNWQVNFFLFIIILSLGQDYNIFVVSRIREELSRASQRVSQRAGGFSPRLIATKASARGGLKLRHEATKEEAATRSTVVEWRALSPIRTRLAVARAIRQTGGVVSSCGLIMAATFASMFSGSLLLMKQMAVAITSGILIDTFVIRPLLVPALLLLTMRRTSSTRIASAGETGEPVLTAERALADLFEGRPAETPVGAARSTPSATIGVRVQPAGSHKQ